MRAKGSGQSSLLLLDVISVLSKQKIPYAIIGAFAASFYGVVRASLDADAVISLTGTNIEANNLVDIFDRVGLNIKHQKGDIDDPIAEVLKITDKYDNQVDLIIGIKGMEANAFSRTVSTLFLGRRICIIGVEDFIAMKIFAGSPKDIDDANGALKISQKNIDFILLEKLTKKYGKKEAGILKFMLKNIKNNNDGGVTGMGER